MTINSICVGNFKGLSERQEFPLKRITLFIGANSSGKSSCIHALAALAQTAKLSSQNRPLVLDDEYAQVHLGRFIEVIHSKSYADRISIGVGFDKIGSSVEFSEVSYTKADDPAFIEYEFSSTKKTQEVQLQKVLLRVGAKRYQANRSGDAFEVVTLGRQEKIKATKGAGFLVRVPFFLRTEAEGKEGKTAASAASSMKILEEGMVFEAAQSLLLDELRKTLYLGPFRQPPARRYATKGASPSEVGALGEFTATLLANESVRAKARPHTKQIGEWLTQLGIARAVDVSRLASSDLFDISMTLHDGENLPIADLGYGLSQVLPVLAQCSFAPAGATLLFEQPELHLHPGAAGKLGAVFVDVIKKKDVTIVAETHSAELYVQILREIASGNVDAADVVAYKVMRIDGRSVIEPIAMDTGPGYAEPLDPWRQILAP